MKKLVRVLLFVALGMLVLMPLSGCGSSFDIRGNWQVTSGQWGQATPGTVIVFNGSQCNLYSPKDTYGISKTSNNNYRLSVTGLLGGNFSFDVTVVDKNHIKLVNGSTSIEMKRLN